MNRRAAVVETAGTYAIILKLSRARAVQIGKLGRFEFAAGYYIYVGRHSTMLRQRVRRHLRGGAAMRWHIDYLRAVCQAVEAWIFENCLDECSMVDRLIESGGARSVGGFGASDCGCQGHLVYFPRKPKVPAEAVLF